MHRIYTARYLVPGDIAPIEGGALLDVNGQIEAVGSLAVVQRDNPTVEVVDFGDALLVPLLVNAHTHLELTDYPEWAEAAGGADESGDFSDWILRLIQVKRGLHSKQFTASIANGISQSLVVGTGAVGDILSQYHSRNVYDGSLLQGVLFLETLGQDPVLIRQAEKELTGILDGRGPGQMLFGVSPHSPYSIRAAYMARIYRKCRAEGLRCATHIAESPAEVEFLQSGKGDLALRFYPAVGWGSFVPRATRRRPVEYLRERGGLFPENLLVHGVQLAAAEIELLADHQMHLVLCPRSNARLQVGKAPVGLLQRAGINLALGTDSRSSCDSLSIWDEMAFASRWFGGEIDAPTLFRMATLGGAAALGLEGELGSLAPGKQSSFQVLQPDSEFAIDELPEYLVASGRSREVACVFVRGRRIVDGLPEADE